MATQAAGFEGHLTKPVNLTALQKMLTKVMNGKPREAPP
jgi:hypothetical protein